MPLTTTPEPTFMVFSGPLEDRSRCAQAIIAAGFAILPEETQEQLGSWGLPSYTDPIVAHEAGHPNAGHQIDQPHPYSWPMLVLEGDHPEGCTLGEHGEPVPCEHVGKTEDRGHACAYVGQPYEADPDIAWLSIQGDAVNSARPAAESVGWSLRYHTAPGIRVVPQPGDITFDSVSNDQLYAELERRYQALKGT